MNEDDLAVGVRDSVEEDENKRNKADFVLWFTKSKFDSQELKWESPWGVGYPGWHIECSTMSTKYLGSSFDFHGGGSDLIFPHHENEIAQSEGATCCHPFVRYWVHNGFITINEEKMSKSLGNFFTVLDILKEYEPEVLRYFILQTHYRSPLDFSDARLKEASRSLERLRTAAQNLTELKALSALVLMRIVLPAGKGVGLCGKLPRSYAGRLQYFPCHQLSLCPRQGNQHSSSIRHDRRPKAGW